MEGRARGFAYQSLFDQLGSVRRAWPGGGWSWDSRLSCVASSIHVELEREAKMAVELAFPHKWTTRNINRAPQLIKEVSELTGGIRPDQTLYATDTVSGSIAYGLWWPWGDDVTISFRIGLSGYAAGREDARLRDDFEALD